MWHTGLVAQRHVGSSQARAQTRVPYIGRWILNNCATREVPGFPFSISNNSEVFLLLLLVLLLVKKISFINFGFLYSSYFQYLFIHSFISEGYNVPGRQIQSHHLCSSLKIPTTCNFSIFSIYICHPRFFLIIYSFYM